MAALGQEGVLVVFASALENVPLGMAEVALAHIPLITFDVGGSAELIDAREHEDLFCGLATVHFPLNSCLLLTSTGVLSPHASDLV
jgi:hypothetical protein